MSRRGNERLGRRGDGHANRVPSTTVVGITGATVVEARGVTVFDISETRAAVLVVLRALLVKVGISVVDNDVQRDVKAFPLT